MGLFPTRPYPLGRSSSVDKLCLVTIFLMYKFTLERVIHCSATPRGIGYGME